MYGRSLQCKCFFHHFMESLQDMERHVLFLYHEKLMVSVCLLVGLVTVNAFSMHISILSGLNVHVPPFKTGGEKTLFTSVYDVNSLSKGLLPTTEPLLVKQLIRKLEFLIKSCGSGWNPVFLCKRGR